MVHKYSVHDLHSLGKFKYLGKYNDVSDLRLLSVTV